MPIMRDRRTWIPVYLLIVWALYQRFKLPKAAWILVAGILAVAVANTLAAELIKPLVKRERPCKVELEARTLVNCGNGYSFPSAHATNHFAISVFLMLIFGRRPKWLGAVLLGWATLVAYAQVYVGVHYPSDVLAGAVLGTLIGGLFAVGVKIFLEKKYGQL